MLDDGVVEELGEADGLDADGVVGALDLWSPFIEQLRGILQSRDPAIALELEVEETLLELELLLDELLRHLVQDQLCVGIHRPQLLLPARGGGGGDGGGGEVARMR